MFGARLVLSPKTIGHPDWRVVPIGELVDGWCQWYDARIREPSERWIPVPWFAESGWLSRHDSPIYRRPVSRRAFIAAMWAAKGKWFKHRLLRIKQT